MTILDGTDRLQNLHAAGADVLGALPGIDRALAALRPVIGAFHRGILVLVRRPTYPLMKVVDQRKDFFGRRLDHGRALNAGSIRLPRGAVLLFCTFIARLPGIR